jgi:hypothetical protein
MIVEYTFTLSDGATHSYRVNIDRAPAQADPARPPAAWTALAFKPCANCPLKTDTHPHCPVALDMEDIANHFRDIHSLEAVTVEVKTPDRTYVKYCDVQTGLRGLLGLIMASSACPITSQLKALSYYHLPFANAEETLFRAVAAYLLQQYFIRKAGGEPDMKLAGLQRLYGDLQIVNAGFKARLDAASENEANIAAINSLNFLSTSVATSLDAALHRLKSKFATPLKSPAG